MTKSTAARVRPTGRQRWTATPLLAAALLAFVVPSVGSVSPAAAVAAGVVSTVAGGPGRGPALNVAQQPGSVAVHGGHLYVSDINRNLVRSVDLASGIESVVAGRGESVLPGGVIDPAGDGGPATGAGLSNPSGIAFDAAGNLFIADTGHHRIRRVDAAGIITTVAGDGTLGFAGDGGPAVTARFQFPRAVAFDPSGNLYIADSANYRVRRVDPAGVITTVAGYGGPFGSNPYLRGDGGPATVAYVEPVALAVDSAGQLYIGENSCDVRKVDLLGVITTVAGVDGSCSSYLGDGGPATAAHLWTPVGLALDGLGHLFIADAFDERVLRVDLAAGTITTAAGTGARGLGVDGTPAAAADLADPGSVAFAGGSLYIGEWSSGLVRRVDTAGLLSTVAGNGEVYSGVGGPAVAAELVTPVGVAARADGTLYVLVSGVPRVFRVDPAGALSVLAGSGANYSYPLAPRDGLPAATVPLGTLTAITVDAAGNVYVAEDGIHIDRIDTNGIFTTVAGGGDAAADGVPATSAWLGNVQGLAVDAAGNLLTAESGAQPVGGMPRIRRITPAGTIYTVAGSGISGAKGDGGPAVAAQLNRPTGVAAGAGGAIFIADTGNGRIRRVDAAGVITTVAGSTGLGFAGDGARAGNARFLPPVGVAVDPGGTVFVADLFNHRVRRIDPRGIVTTVAGTGIRGGTGDGGPARTATLDGPAGIALDGAGNLYVAETYGNRIRKVAAAGAIPLPAASARAAGWNPYGEVGDGSAATRAAPVAVALPFEPVAVAGGVLHSLAVAVDGTVWAWGYNGLGQLGDGTITSRASPAPVSGLAGVVGVAGGAHHSLAVRADGTVWAWGFNAYGQLGDGTTLDRHTPVQVAGLTHVVAVAAGFYHSVALRDDGTVWSWGYNGQGEVGDGTHLDRHVPVPVAGLTAVTSLAAGAFHALAVGQNGTVWAWGWNYFGQLGDGTVVDRATPVQVPGQYAVDEVAAGFTHSMAVTAPGGPPQLFTWGGNAQGQLGDGTRVDRHSPIAVAGVADVSTIAAGGLHSLAVTTSGRLEAWGWNGLGQLGDGTTTDRLTPTLAAEPAGVVAVAHGGAYHTLVVRLDPR